MANDLNGTVGGKFVDTLDPANGVQQFRVSFSNGKSVVVDQTTFDSLEVGKDYKDGKEVVVVYAGVVGGTPVFDGPNTRISPTAPAVVGTTPSKEDPENKVRPVLDGPAPTADKTK